MDTGDIHGFFYPGCVAVAGASASSWKLGNVVISNMRLLGFKGSVFPLHPESDTLMGLRAYRSLAAIPEKVDLAVAAIPRERMPGFVRECGEAGVRRVIACAAGFSDVGGEGETLERELARAARSSGVRVMGPNSVGTICTESKLATSLLSLMPLKQGNVSIVAQTGLFAAGYARMFAGLGAPGISKVACLGNRADIDETELTAYLEGDRGTGVIGLYTEGLKRGREFLETARSVARRKPVVMLLGAQTEAGARAALGHTGSLASPGAVALGAMKQAGVFVVGTAGEYIACIKALSMCPPAAGGGVGVVSATGAGCVMAADQLAGTDLTLPAPSGGTVNRLLKIAPPWSRITNPADIWAAVETGRIHNAYRAFMEAFADQEDVHIILAILTLVPESRFDAAEVFLSLRERRPEKPILCCVLGAHPSELEELRASLEPNGFPVYDDLREAVTAAASLRHFGKQAAGDGDGLPARSSPRALEGGGCR